VTINDKHIEIIIRQMLRKVRITDPGDTENFWGEQVDRANFLAENRRIEEAGGKPAEAEPILRAAYDARVAAMGAEAQGTIYALLELVICLRVRGETEEAIPLARTCVAAATKQFGARNFSTLHARATLASLLATAPSETEHAEALAIAEAAHVAAERTLGPSNPTTLRCLLAEAHSHEALAQHGESLRLLDELDARLRDPRVGLRTFAREVAAFRSTIAPSP
jgi:hypothetical protein